MGLSVSKSSEVLQSLKSEESQLIGDEKEDDEPLAELRNDIDALTCLIRTNEERLEDLKITVLAARMGQSLGFAEVDYIREAHCDVFLSPQRNMEVPIRRFSNEFNEEDLPVLSDGVRPSNFSTSITVPETPAENSIENINFENIVHDMLVYKYNNISQMLSEDIKRTIESISYPESGQMLTKSIYKLVLDVHGTEPSITAVNILLSSYKFKHGGEMLQNRDALSYCLVVSAVRPATVRPGTLQTLIVETAKPKYEIVEEGSFHSLALKAKNIYVDPSTIDSVPFYTQHHEQVLEGTHYG